MTDGPNARLFFSKQDLPHRKKRWPRRGLDSVIMQKISAGFGEYQDGCERYVLGDAMDGVD